MVIIYDIIFFLFAAVLIPVYLFKGKFHRGLIARLGFLPRGLPADKPIWIHAVSVGEAMAVRGLLEGLRKAYPGKKFVISTVTATGNKIAKSMAQPGDCVIYLPLDLSFIVGAVVDKIDPCLFIIAETEIWPNLISCLHRKKIPVVTVNGRISDASFRGYKAVKFLLKPVLDKISFYCVQSARDCERLMRLGVAQNKIQVTGNMKFDVSVRLGAAGDQALYRSRLGLTGTEKLFTAASTHPGEEEAVLEVYKDLLNEFPDLKLLIAPRHPERAEGVAKLASKNGFLPVLVSGLGLIGENGRRTTDDGRRTAIFVLDTIGELIHYYAVSDIVFVGGSLVKKGGHNIIEPASFAKPVVFGPQTFNFRDITELFLRRKAAIMVRNTQELKAALRLLLSDSNRARELADAAGKLILENQGATLKNIERIKDFLT